MSKYLDIEIHGELDRVRAHADRVDLVFALVVDPSLDQALAEHVVVQLPRDRVEYARYQAERLRLHEGVEPVAAGVGDQYHVRFVDRRPAAQARRVEADSALEILGAELLYGDGEVVPLAEQVSEPHVYEFGSLLGRKFQRFFSAHLVAPFAPVRLRSQARTPGLPNGGDGYVL